MHSEPQSDERHPAEPSYSTGLVAATASSWFAW